MGKTEKKRRVGKTPEKFKEVSKKKFAKTTEFLPLSGGHPLSFRRADKSRATSPLRPLRLEVPAHPPAYHKKFRMCAENTWSSSRRNTKNLVHKQARIIRK